MAYFLYFSLKYNPALSQVIYISFHRRSHTYLRFLTRLQHSTTFREVATLLLTSRVSNLNPHAAMDRSAQELFLNFMIVLITVLLMWLLVRAYQE